MELGVAGLDDITGESGTRGSAAVARPGVMREDPLGKFGGGCWSQVFT